MEIWQAVFYYLFHQSFNCSCCISPKREYAYFCWWGVYVSLSVSVYSVKSSWLNGFWFKTYIHDDNGVAFGFCWNVCANVCLSMLIQWQWCHWLDISRIQPREWHIFLGFQYCFSFLTKLPVKTWQISQTVSISFFC